jgi:predicted alpha-1,2-mannosidase
MALMNRKGETRILPAGTNVYMKNSFSVTAALLLLFVSIAGGREKGGLGEYVRPLVGGKGEGNTFPGPAAPFGMIQISPDTDKTNWDTASGYEYSDPTILGFSLTHLSGTGIPDLGDFLFMPQVGRTELESGMKDKPDEGYQSKYSHDDETVSIGYYRVKLQKPAATVELTAGERAGFLRFTFPESTQASIMTDLSHMLSGKKWRVVQARVRVEDKQTITGFHLVNGWAKERYLYFAARYSRPFEEAVIYKNGKPEIYDSYLHYRFRSRNEAAATNLQFFAKYKTKPGETIAVKVAVSTVSTANALENLEAEIPDWNFEKLRDATREKWDRELRRIEVEGTPLQKETFYTSLYHCFLTPNIHQDANGQYRGFDQNIHTAKGFTKYTVFSLWDTFRAEHPLLALIQSKRDSDMIRSLLAHYDQSADHLLPMWELQGNETWCMIGYHAVPVIADGYLKGVKGFDVKHAYEAVKTTAMNPDYDGLAAYRKLGYVPFDKENESLSKTLEYAYDDYCIAQMAKALGKRADYEYFMKRAGSYKNIYDPTIGWMRPKNSEGKWRDPFKPVNYGPDINNDVTEGTSSQYSWFVPHDVPGLMRLFGGRERFVAKLDNLFTSTEGLKQLSANDQRGCIGDYWHGNEPSHHIIYLYCYAGQPWKAAERLRQVVTTQYGNQPDSLCGNDDCGQMSAWYVFTCMGFYPVAPASGYYVLGAPQLPRAIMHLSNGKDLGVTAEDLSEKNLYVQSVRVNGKAWNTPFLPHREIARGGKIVFQMGPHPNKSWATEAAIPQ